MYKSKDVMFEFSQGLKNRLISFFKTEYDFEVSPEEANLFLRSLGNVYDALTKSDKSNG